jgi:hypothetical protein
MVSETLSQKHSTQKRAGRVAQGVGPEFKPQYPPPKNNCKKEYELAGGIDQW